MNIFGTSAKRLYYGPTEWNIDSSCAEEGQMTSDTMT